MRRVLVADDEPQNRLLLRSLLQPLGFAVEEVTDGGKCLEACERRPPDLLLLDLRMPRVDGLDVARALRRSVLARGVKIIAVSASVFESDAQEALDAGCDDFVPKPFREEQLLAAMARVLGVSWRTDEPVPAATAPTEPAPILPPAAEELDALLELSQRGDIVRLKRRLAALAEGDARYAPFAKSLRPFVSRLPDEPHPRRAGGMEAQMTADAHLSRRRPAFPLCPMHPGCFAPLGSPITSHLLRLRALPSQ